MYIQRSTREAGPYRDLYDTQQVAGWFGQPAAAPAFRFFCAPGCAPHAANECRAIVRRAIQDAIALAEGAATKLEARDGEALRLFRAFFGDPAWLVPWADNRPAPDLVAHRLRAAANAFRRRVPHIRCSTDADCNAFVQPTVAPSPANPLPRNTIFLCTPFWTAAVPGTLPRYRRAGIVLHEMLHLLYHGFLIHQRRFANAHCYEAFVMRAAGHGADPTDRECCQNPAACA